MKLSVLAGSAALLVPSCKISIIIHATKPRPALWVDTFQPQCLAGHNNAAIIRFHLHDRLADLSDMHAWVARLHDPV